jgi:hypothetical protein
MSPAKEVVAVAVAMIVEITRVFIRCPFRDFDLFIT